MKFFQDKKAYEPPTDYKVIFEAFCLGHFIAVLEFTSSVCKFIGVEESEVSPINHTPKEIKKLIRDKLKAIAHLKRVALGKCELCHTFLSGTQFIVTCITAAERWIYCHPITSYQFALSAVFQ